MIGAVGIADTTLVAVLERGGEIGLRRAPGARGRHITAPFPAESGALGVIGGLVGTALGVCTVIGVALVRDWTPVVHPATVAGAPATGLAMGLVAGLHPAWRAAGIEPAEALRRPGAQAPRRPGARDTPVRRRAVPPPRSDGPSA